MHTPSHPENLQPGDLITVLDYLDPPPTRRGRRILNPAHPYIPPGLILSVISHSHPYLAVSLVRSLSPLETKGPYSLDLRRITVTHLSKEYVDACIQAAAASLQPVPPPTTFVPVEFSDAPDPSQLNLFEPD